MNFVQQIFVVFHMFEHFDRHDPIVVLDNIEGTLVVGDIACNDGDIINIVSPSLSGRQDIFTLRTAVGNACNLGVAVLYWWFWGVTRSRNKIRNTKQILRYFHKI